jgi:hypothetical protein
VWAVQCYDRQTGNVSVKHGVWQDKPVCNFGQASEQTEKKVVIWRDGTWRLKCLRRVN